MGCRNHGLLSELELIVLSLVVLSVVLDVLIAAVDELDGLDVLSPTVDSVVLDTLVLLWLDSVVLL